MEQLEIFCFPIMKFESGTGNVPYDRSQHILLLKTNGAAEPPRFIARFRSDYLSTISAVPMPPPMHRVARPFFASLLFISYSRVTRILQPDAPIG